MGTYTPNYGLYKPDIGEKDWGDKVNANFDTIDNVMHENRSQIDKIKKDVLTIALNVMMNKALVHAETKDFYSIIADVITDEYPNGFKNTFETIPFGVTFDNDGGGTWTQAIKVTLTTVPSEYAQYRIVIQSNTMQIYAADGTLKADYGASTGVASEFWNNVKSDGSDIRIADQNYSQLYFWIEEFDYSGKYAVIWVKVEAGTSELYIVYGNPSATKSAYENPEQVFEFFDDFEDGVLSPGYDTFGEGGKEANGVLTLKDTNSSFDAVFLNRLLNYNHVVYARVYARDLQLLQNRILQQDPLVNKNFYRAYFEAGETRINKNVNGTWSSPVSLAWQPPLNTWFIERIVVDITGGELRFEFPEYGKSLSLTETLNWTSGYFGFGVYQADIDIDYWFIAKLADPASFGDAEVITLTTTGGFITVTFSFDEGVDKLLITADTDAQAIYYSTDDGQTWNAIEPDTETPLPETAYSIKWKFEFATYVRGYAFITW